MLKSACLDFEGQTVIQAWIFYIDLSSSSVTVGLHLLLIGAQNRVGLEARAKKTGLGGQGAGFCLGD